MATDVKQRLQVPAHVRDGLAALSDADAAALMARI